MKLLTSTVLALLGLITGAASHAAYYEQTGTIHTVSTSAPDLWGDYDYLLLNTFTSAGNCGLIGGLVAVKLPHSKAYAAALAAQASGRRVTVSLDDTRRDSSGICILRWMNVLD